MMDEYGERITYLGTGIGDPDAAKRYLRRRWNQGVPEPVQTRAGAFFYVTARPGRKFVPLLGPYVSHLSALSAVPRARALLTERGGMAGQFASVGTASAPKRVTTVFGR
jgi:hypothetical protein